MHRFGTSIRFGCCKCPATSYCLQGNGFINVPTKLEQFGRGEHLAQWDGAGENCHQCSDILNGWIGETGFSWLLQALCWLSQICVQAEQWGARWAEWIHGQHAAFQRTLTFRHPLGSVWVVCHWLINFLLVKFRGWTSYETWYVIVLRNLLVRLFGKGSL